MFRKLLYFSVIFLSISINAQEKEITSFTESDDVVIENAPSYYSNYFSEMQLNNKWRLRLENTKLRLNLEGPTLYEYLFLFKYNISKTWSVYSGSQLDLEMDADIRNFNIINSNIRGVLGVEKELTPNLLLDARYNIKILNIKYSEQSMFNNKSGFNLGSRFRF